MILRAFTACRLLPLLLLLPAATSAQCDPKEYARIFAEAQALQEKGRFIEAKNTYEAAKVYACKAQEKDAADVAVDRLFEQIDRLRIEADSLALSIYANDLAYKSQVVLQDGDLTTAFRLAEFAYRFVDNNNAAVRQSLYNVLYHNDLADTSKHLFWTSQEVYNFWGVNLSSFAFAPDSSSKCLIAAASDNNTVRLFVKGDSVPTLLHGHAGPVYNLAFSPDGRNLASAAEDRTIKIWDLNSLACIRTLTGYSGEDLSSCLSYFPDGKRLATCAENREIDIWNLETGRVEMTLAGARDEIGNMVISRSGKFIAAASADSVIWVYDAATGEKRSSLQPNGDISNLDFSPDDQKMAVGLNDNSVEIYAWETNALLHTIKGGASFRVILPRFISNDRITTFSFDETLKAWDLKIKKNALTLDGHWQDIASVAFSPDGKKIATGGLDFSGKVWNAESGEKIMALECDEYTLSLDFSPDGRWLAGGLYDSTAVIWNLQTGGQVKILKGHNGQVESVDFSPDCKFLATGSSDSTAIIWDMETGKPFRIFRHPDQAECVAFSPDGRFLAVGQSDTIVIWDPLSGKPVNRLTGKHGWINSLAFAPDSNLLCAGTGSGNLEIWSVPDGDLLLNVKDQGNPINSVAFSPDGRQVAFGNQRSMDGGCVRFLSLESGKILFTLDGHSAAVNSVAFSPDGKKLVSGSRDNSAKVWRLDLDTLIEETYALKPNFLSKEHLIEYSLENLLDLRPQNESLLLQTGDTWQIAAFAELYADKIERTGFPQKADYERALRLYRACLESGTDKSYFNRKIEELQAEWERKKE